MVLSRHADAGAETGAETGPAVAVTGVAALTDDLPAWAGLAASDPQGGLFAHPAFAACFAQVFAGPAQVFTASSEGGIGQGAEPVQNGQSADPAQNGQSAVMPMMQTRLWRGLRLAPRFDYLAGDQRFLLHTDRRFIPLRQISPLLGLEATSLRSAWVQGGDVSPGDLWQGIAACCAARRGWDIGVFPLAEPDLPPASRAMAAAGLAPVLHRLDRSFHTIETVQDSAGILAGQSQKFRQNIRRAERLAEREGAVFEMLEGAAVLAALPDFAELAAGSWKAAPVGRGGGKDGVNSGGKDGNKDAKGGALRVPYEGGQRRFVEALCRAEGVQPILSRVSLGGQTMAACLSFYQAGCLTTALIFQRPSKGAAAWGRLVIHRLLDLAAARGALRVDLNSNAEWVQSYADTVSVVQNLLIFPRGLRGALLRRLALLRGEPL